VRAPELSGRITVSTTVSLTLSFLQEHLLAFQAAHPALELDCALSDKPDGPWCAKAWTSHCAAGPSSRTPRWWRCR